MLSGPMETLICFIVAGSLVCEVKPLDRERGDFEPIEIVAEKRIGIWPPEYGGDLVIRCHDPHPCRMKYSGPSSVEPSYSLTPHPGLDPFKR